MDFSRAWIHFSSSGLRTGRATGLQTVRRAEGDGCSSALISRWSSALFSVVPSPRLSHSVAGAARLSCRR
ncbi:hypothetical protein EYF80_065932 [Liparis tanakae]|uniref:Uncharacterized protein n=1 Tax=Liparis tanakae TaxID=230148 RepID=A0A4Z2E594_9TELE|nr:hypothetical protein EYF80_065932 [Liparis tanakae]